MSATRVRECLQKCADEKRAALVVYLTQGDPSESVGTDLLCAVAEAGADIIELGVPFSDPCADGPVIQDAMFRALAGGGGMQAALSTVKVFRESGFSQPVILFGYYNPICVLGADTFAAQASAAGVDAVLTVDLPMDELAELSGPLAKEEVGVVPLVAPTSGEDRIGAIAALNPAFVYYVSKTGITGSAFVGASGGEDRVAKIRELTESPVCVGFGIKSPEDASAIAQFADGVVVGSALVDKIAKAGSGAEAIRDAADFVKQLRAAMQKN